MAVIAEQEPQQQTGFAWDDAQPKQQAGGFAWDDAPAPAAPSPNKQLPDATIGAAPAPGYLDRVGENIRNSAVGKALGMEPTLHEGAAATDAQHSMPSVLPEWTQKPLLNQGAPDTPLGKIDVQAAQRFRQAHPVAGGVTEGVQDVAQGLTSPANIALMMAAPESKILSGYFAAQAAQGSYQSAEQAHDAFVQGNNHDAAKFATESGLQALVAAVAGRHALQGGGIGYDPKYGVVMPPEPPALGPGARPPVEMPPERPMLPGGSKGFQWDDSRALPAKTEGPSPSIAPPPPVDEANARTRIAPTKFNEPPAPVPDRGVVVDAEGRALRGAPALPAPPKGFKAAKASPPPGPLTVEQAPPRMGSDAVPTRPVIQSSANPEEIRASAEHQQPVLEKATQIATQGVPGAEVEGQRVKDPESIANKAERGKPVETTTDVLAGRVSAPVEELPQVEKNIEQKLPVVSKDTIDSNGLNVTQYEVRTGTPGEPNQVSEIQVTTPEQAEAMKQTDGLYEKQKQALARGDRQEAEIIGNKIREIVEKSQPIEQQKLPAVLKPGTRVTSPAGKTGDVMFFDQRLKRARVKYDDGTMDWSVKASELRPAEAKGGKAPAEPDTVSQALNKPAQNIPKDIPETSGKEAIAAKLEEHDSEHEARKREEFVGRRPSNQVAKQEVADEPIPEAKGDKWIGVDLDKTLAHYEKFEGPTKIGAPIPKMVERVKRMLDEGNNVRILTARISEDPTGEAKKAIEDWTEQHIGQKLEVTDKKDAHMVSLYDDRAVPVEANTGELLAHPQQDQEAGGGAAGFKWDDASGKGSGATDAALTKAIRQGDISPDGAYFSLPGFSTYHDEQAVEQRRAKRYDLSKLNLADSRDAQTVIRLLTETLKDPALTPEEKTRAQGILDDARRGEPLIDYRDNDELPIPAAAKRLGYDGIRVTENDDLPGDASSVFAWKVGDIKAEGQSERRKTAQPDGQPRERRADVAERKRVAEMSPEEMSKELLTSQKTGLPNRRAFDEAEKESKSPAVGMSDADGLKALNDKFGYEAGDNLLRAKADALKQAGIEAYHDKGDEFLYRGSSSVDLNAKLEKARQILRDRPIFAEMKDGTIKQFKGADFSYGTGNDLSKAESNLKNHKDLRESWGERKRGELRGIAEVGPEAGKERPDAAAKPERAPVVQGQAQGGAGEAKAGDLVLYDSADGYSAGIGRVVDLHNGSANVSVEKVKGRGEGTGSVISAKRASLKPYSYPPERAPEAPKPTSAAIIPTRAGVLAVPIKDEAAEPEAVDKPVNALINAIYSKLEDGQSLGNVTELNKLAEKHLGASRTSGEWTPKDVFDAMEAAVNKYLLDIGKGLYQMPATEALSHLRNLMARLTSQATRTEDQVKNQQFSTPPTESYVVARVAALKPSDVVLEPSAGNGGLAVWPKAIGAEVHVNEIAPRRQAMLEEVGFDKPTEHDGELINALLDHSIKPTVVLMNPPFSASTMKSYEAKNQSRYGFNHVEQALQRLAEGGRLVAILGGGREGFQGGEGASLRIGEAGKWFDKIAQEYNVRANIRVDGKEYAKYGTSYATRIIVIDKDGPTPSKAAAAGNTWDSTIEKDVDTLEEAYTALKPVEETRPTSARPENADRSPRRPAPSGVGSDTGPSVPSVRTSARGSGSASGKVSAPVRSDQPRPSSPEPPADSGSDKLPVHSGGSKAGRSNESEAPGGAGTSLAHGDSQRQVAERGIELEREEEKVKREEEDESAYATYQPTLKGAKHPGSIVETKSMATVPMPPITYKPNLPENVIGKAPDFDNAKLSAVQLEAVAIAGMQNDIKLPGGFRASALIGDGTGVGKGREGAAILWDNWRKGRKRLVWMTKSKDLIMDAVRDLEGIGAKDLAKSIKNLGKLDASTPIEHEGILFTTYALFRSGDKKGNTRATQIDRWLRGDDEGEGGYLLMDESHNLKNAVVSQGGQASQIGQTVKKFLEKMPPLRTVSLSATAATDVMNLGYLDRLGLWGPGTPFPNGFNQFAGEIAHGGMSAMEMIARELKAQGKYVSRTLTYRGVKYSEIEHEITPDQKAIYASAAKAWRDVFNSAEHTIMHTTGGGSRQKAMAMSQFFSAQQRFFNLLLTSIKIPTAVKEAEAALARGESVAITLVNTNEAAQNREKDRVAADESGEEPDYDFGPGKMITDLVEEHYPTQQYKDDVDSNGNPIKVPVVDAKGNPVQNPQALAAKKKLLDELSQLRMPANPLDELIELLGGPSKVAELTGRKQRYDAASNRLVNRGGNGVSQDKVNKSEEAAFQAGRKRVAILSSAADTGISLHSDKGAKNQQKRFVITLQVGWSADKAMQMNGRFNRSNQANAPEYALLKTNLGGESRFISSIARRMESLEALSKGQTKTNTGTEAMSKVNFETDQGRAASVAFYDSLLGNREVPGALDASGEPLTGREILKQLRVLKGQSGGGETVPPADRANITRLLNRLLALDPDVQQPVYNYFYDIFDATVKRAEADGTLDTGVKRLPGDQFEIKEQRELSADPATGAKTFYYPIDSQVRIHRMSAAVLEEKYERLKKNSDHPIIMRGPAGELALMADAKPIIHADGKVQEAVHVMTPESLYASKDPASKYHNWKAIDASVRDRVEKAESAIEQADHDITYYGKLAERYKDNDPYGYAKRVDEAKQEKESAQKEYKEARTELRKLDPVAMAREEWQKQFEAAPGHITATHHLVGGAVMRFWNPIREASGRRLDVFSAVDSKSGDRVVGIEIPGNQIKSLIARITGGKSTIDANQIMDDVFKNATQYDLEGGIKIRRGRVAGNNVIQFVTGNGDAQESLKKMGVLYERGMQPVYYLPTGEYGGWSAQGEKILEKILEQYPAKIAGADEAPDTTAKDFLQGGRDAKLPNRHTPGSTTYAGGFLDPQLFKDLFPEIAQRIADWSTETITPGDQQREMMRETRGERDRQIAAIAKKLETVQKAWTYRPRADSMRFWNAVEQQNVQSLDPQDQPLARLFESGFAPLIKEIQALKPAALQNLIDGYFPHLWERPSSMRSTLRGLVSGRRPFAGKASFLKQRTIPTMEDGLQLGFVPVSWNPVEIFLRKYAEMSQYLMAHKTLEMMKDAGTAKMVSIGKKAPDNWQQLDDSIGTVYSYNDDDQLFIRGHYYAPAQAARVFNNFVSRGLSGRTGIYDTLRWINNNMNALQLGISGFHAATTSINVAVSEVALGIEQLTQGKPIKGVGHIVSGMTIAPSIVRTMVNGSRLMSEYLDPGSYSRMAAEAAAVAEAGGRAMMDPIEIKPFSKMVNAFRSGAIREGLWQVPGTILHATVAPVMDWLVPRMKLGAFYDMAENVFDEAAKHNWDEEEIRRKLQRAWDSVDNRFGQMVYENLFWHRAMQDTLMLATRSVGWNYGDLRELGGAGKDFIREATKPFQGKMPELTPRMGFAIALPLVTGLIGAVLTYLWQKRHPLTWKDYFYPLRPDGTRVSIPGYMKDVIGFYHHPIDTVINKQSPILEATSEAIQNRDFYGTEIRHKDDPVVKQLLQVAQWFGRQSTPFSISGTKKLVQKEGEDTTTIAGTLKGAAKHPQDVLLGQFGFQPAPAVIQNSDALNMAREYQHANYTPGTRTKEQAARRDAMREVEDMYRRKSVNKDTIASFKKEGVLTEQDLLKARFESRTDPLYAASKSLHPDQLLKVYQAGTADERKTLRPLLEQKGRELTGSAKDEDTKALRDAIRETLHPAPKFTRPTV